MWIDYLYLDLPGELTSGLHFSQPLPAIFAAANSCFPTSNQQQQNSPEASLNSNVEILQQNEDFIIADIGNNNFQDNANELDQLRVGNWYFYAFSGIFFSHNCSVHMTRNAPVQTAVCTFRISTLLFLLQSCPFPYNESS